MARDTWYRLDNIGKFYSSQAGNPVQAVFRYSATLIEDVDETVLQHALDRAVEVYPSFNVCLRNGIFWHYLEQAAHPPRVQQENLPICFGLHVDTRDGSSGFVSGFVSGVQGDEGGGRLCEKSVMHSAKPNRSIHGSAICSNGFRDGACAACSRSVRSARFAQTEGGGVL